jgi:transcriptional regulator with XRE-family HTH domain
MSPRPRRKEDALGREHRQALGRALGILRRRRKERVEDAAERSAVHTMTYRLWERGEVEPTIEHLRDALAALQYDFHDLQYVLEAVENFPEQEPSVEPEPTEEERLIREIVRNFTALFEVRQKGEGAGQGS